MPDGAEYGIGPVGAPAAAATIPIGVNGSDSDTPAFIVASRGHCLSSARTVIIIGLPSDAI